MGQRFLTAAALALLAAAPGFVPGVHAADEVGLWGQCGGINYQGPTQCVSGAICMKYNDWYHQCIPAPSTSSSATPSTSSSTRVTSSSSTRVTTTSSTTRVTTTSSSTTRATTSSTLTTLTTSTRTTSSSSTPSNTADPCALKFLITFGDSYSQTGFNVSSTKPSTSNPLGNPPLPGWTASGGLNWVGFLVSQFNTSATFSYNFAYGGATTNASIVQPYQPTVLSFIDQVAQFSGSIASKPSYAPWFDENALFGVWIGVNDVGNSWWKAEYDQIVQQIMDSYFGQLQILYNAGARNFVLLTVPPIHRTPVMQQESAATQQAEAAAIAKYNAALSTRLAAFRTANAGITAKIVDTAAPFNTALDNPTAYGAPNATCYNSDGKSCLWFNDYHPGIEINRLVAKAVADAWKDSFF